MAKYIVKFAAEAVAATFIAIGITKAYVKAKDWYRSSRPKSLEQWVKDGYK